MCFSRLLAHSYSSELATGYDKEQGRSKAMEIEAVAYGASLVGAQKLRTVVIYLLILLLF